MLAHAMQELTLEGCKGPVVCRPDTGCKVHLGAGLTPTSLSHTSKCKCLPVKTDEELARLVTSVQDAIKMYIMEVEKPSMAFAMLLLGADVVYPDASGVILVTR
ncbi:hypothetical protein F4805DRAFT_457243 [Annulohypoxylon moriforme]|nr:hypothetical protein F4805DRAFT_457243 [Annulohypoxylon moriforme]